MIGLLLLSTASATPWGTVAERPQPLPEPLERAPWEIPAAEVRTLSNGLEVHVATNNEVPLWEARLVFAVGKYIDPEGKEGLAEVTFDMMDEGAGDRTAADLSRDLKQIAGSVSSWVFRDTGYVAATGTTRHLEATLDLWASVVLEPSFPEPAWEIEQKRRLAELEVQRDDPRAIVSRAYFHLKWGDSYLGRFADEDSLGSITTEDMRGFYDTYVGPTNAVLLVGGDITADEILPLLEARIGDWAPEGIEAAPTDPRPQTIDEPILYLIDKPGVTQTQIWSMSFIGTRTDPEHYPLRVANQAHGRAFIGRLNMNLREDKGYTYGAHCYLTYRDGPGVHICSTSVDAVHTRASMDEMQKELVEMLGDRPLSEDEVTTARNALVHGFPGDFETVEGLLDESVRIWRYGLPADWTTAFMPAISEVTAETANEAFRNAIDPGHMYWLVVGDKEKILGEIEDFGPPIVELDRDGRRLDDGD